MTEQTPTLADMTPAQIDAELYELYRAEGKAEQGIEMAKAAIRRTAGDKQEYMGRRRVWALSFDEAMRKTTTIAKEQAATYVGRDAQRNLDRYAEAIAQHSQVLAAQVPYDAEYVARGRWTRAFLAQSSNGHVHNTMDCSTCNNGEQPTRFSWMVAYSGKDEAEIVEAAGERACTVCYPSAPVDVLKRPTKMFTEDEIEAQKAREERAAKKEAAAAKKAAKAIANPDGSPLEVFTRRYPERQVMRGDKVIKVHPAHDGYDTLETLHAARGWLTDQYETGRGNNGTHQDTRKVAEAIARKEGKTAEQAIEEAKGRAARRR